MNRLAYNPTMARITLRRLGRASKDAGWDGAVRNIAYEAAAYGQALYKSWGTDAPTVLQAASYRCNK